MIIQNSARCCECDHEVISTHRHDYVTCNCGNLSVDGGLSYLRRSFKTANWEDTSITTKDDQ